MFYGFFLVLFVIICILSFRNTKYGILFLIMIVPFNLQIKIMLGLNLFSKVWHNLLILVLCIAVIAKSAITKNSRIFKLNQVDIILFLMLCYGLFLVGYNFLTTNSWYLALQGFRTHYFGVLLYFIVREHIKNFGDVKKLIKIIIIVVLVASIEIIAEFILLNLQIIDSEALVWLNALPGEYAAYYRQGAALLASYGELIRPFGIFYNMQYSAALILIGVLIMLPFFTTKYLHNKTIKSLYIRPVFFYIIMLGLFLSTARTVILSFLIIYIFLLFITNASGKKFTIYALALFFVSLVSSNVLLDFYSISSGDVHFSDTWTSVSAFPDVIRSASIYSFLYGIGFSADPFAKNVLGVASQYDVIMSAQKGGAEGLLKFSYEVGILGIALFAIQNFIVYKRGIKLSNKLNSSIYKNILTGLSVVTIAVVLCSAHVVPTTAPGIQYIYYIILGIIASYNIYWHKDFMKIKTREQYKIS